MKVHQDEKGRNEGGHTRQREQNRHRHRQDITSMGTEGSLAWLGHTEFLRKCKKGRLKRQSGEPCKMATKS